MIGEVRVAVEAGCLLGEGALWDATRNRVLWVDIKNPAIWSYEPTSKHAQRHAMLEPVGFVVPGNDGGYVAGFKSGLYRLDPTFTSRALIAVPEPQKPGNRINDGALDTRSRIWLGTMDDAEQNPTGDYWFWDGRALTRHPVGWIVTNGPAFSPDGKQMYLANSAARSVFAVDLNGDGRAVSTRPYVQFGESDGYPDGMAVDREGYVWIAHWDGARVTRFSPDGRVQQIVDLPVSRPTKCAFDSDEHMLYITSASIGTDRTKEPGAGHLFAVEIR